MKKVILASGSRQRKLLVETLGIKFKIVPADVDEQAVKYFDLKTRAENIARAKAEAVAKDHKDAVIIAADTYVVKDNKILEKPQNLVQAKEMIKDLSGDKFVTYSGYCYIDEEAGINQSGVSETVVEFRELSPNYIDHYVNNNPVMEWSAAFSPAYHEGMSLVGNISGSFTSFTHGLPLEVITPLLQKSGINI